MNQFELGLLDFIQDHIKCEFLDTVMPFITKLANGGIFWIICAIVLIAIKRTRKTGICVGVSLIIGLVFGNLILKNVFARIRPYDVNIEFKLLVARLSDYSFPSGHTLASFEAAVVLLIKNKRLGIPAILLAVLIAFSRLYLYVHYPSDVLAGMILGTVFAFAACLIVDKAYKYTKERKLKKHQ